MANQVRQAYQIVDNPYYQALNENPAVELVIENTEVQTSRKSGNHEQQRLASQMPRGTRIDETGTKIQVRGGRNYTSRKLFISREEMFDDVVVRGLRADGLSTKLGVKNHKDGIAKLLSDLFEGDSRQPIVEDHFKTRRQKSNSAKTMFATMTHEELQFLKAETFPSRIDVQVRDYLTNTFIEEPQKLQAAVEVLGQIQQIFKVLTPHTDFLSSHNFQTRGFFLDIVLMTCSFLMQIIQDTDGNPEANPKPVVSKNDTSSIEGSLENIQEKIVKENKTAAEILLSVGSDILDKSEIGEGNISFVRKHSNSRVPKNEPGIGNTSGNPSGDSSAIALNEDLPTTVVVEGTRKTSSEGDHWATVEMVDGHGNTRYMLIKTHEDNAETFSAVKILEMLQNQGVELDDSMEIALSNPTSVKSVKKSDAGNPSSGEKVMSELESNIDSEESKHPGKPSIHTQPKSSNKTNERVIVEVERMSQEPDAENIISTDSMAMSSEINLGDAATMVISEKDSGKRKDPGELPTVGFEITEPQKRRKKD